MNSTRRAIAAVAGVSAVASSMSGGLLALAPAVAAPAPGQDLLNDWGQAAWEVDDEINPIVDADARVVAVRARYARALAAYASIKRVEKVATAAYKRALQTRTRTDDVRTAASLAVVKTRVVRAAREVVASQLALVTTVKAVDSAVRSRHYVRAPYVAPPAQPSGLAATGASAQVSLSWAAVDGATTYKVLRDNTQIATTIIPSYTDTGLDNTMSYAYKVIAQNVAGWSPVSAEVTGSPTAAAPTVPTALVAAPGDGAVSLAWASSALATGYRVYRDGILVGSPNGTTFTDSGVTNGTAYAYRVSAVNGDVPSAQSAAVPCTPVAAAPAAPTGLVATPGNAQVTLSWSASPTATSYRVYRGGVLVGSPSSTSLVELGLTNGTPYSYYVVAVSQNSPASAASATVSATPVTPPLSQPNGLAATPGDTQIALSWGAVSGATSYRVYRGGALVASPTATSLTDTGLANGTPYTYYVIAVGPASSSAPSATTTATPAAAAPGAPTGLTGQAGDGTAALSWNPVSGATSYQVYRGGALVATVATTSWTNIGLSNGTSYSYYVTVTNNAVESAASATVSVTPFVVTPGIPGGVVTTPGSTQVSLSWMASANAQSYRVYRGATLIASPTGLTALDTGLTNGVAYTYTVVAVNGSASSAASAAATATPMAPAPAAPTGLTATPGNGQVVLGWTAVPTATSYRVYRSGALVASPTSTTYTDIGLTNATTYSYYVVAVAATTPGPASATVSATPVRPPVNGTFTGPITTITGHGTMRVVIVLTNSVITSATGTLLTNDGSETVSINANAMPIYNQKAVTANSANITLVSGATLTYAAYKTSLQSALTAAGL